MATLSIESDTPLDYGTEYTYTKDGTQVGLFTCKSISKNGNKYSMTLYDKTCSLQQNQRQALEADTTKFYYYDSNGTISYGVYASTSSHNFTEREYFEATIGLNSVAGYYPISISAPNLQGLWLGNKFTIDGNVGYVQSISWDIDKYTISSQVTESDNTTTLEDEVTQVERTVIEQGETITSLTTEVGRISASVSKKNSVYRQNYAPTGTDFKTGDLWYNTSEEGTGAGKWHMWEWNPQGWSVITDKDIETNSARIDVTEENIGLVVDAEHQTIKAGDIVNTINNTSGISINEDKLTLTSTHQEISALDGRVETAEGTISTHSDQIAARVVKSYDGGSAYNGMSWNLTDSAWTVNNIKQGTESAVMTVNSNGLTVKGEIQADSGYIGKLSLNDGWLRATENTSQGISLQKGTGASVYANDYELTNLRTNGLSYEYGPTNSPTTAVTIDNNGVTTNKLRLISATVDATNATVTMTSGTISGAERILANHLAVSSVSYGSANPSGGEVGDIYFKI